MASKSIFSSCSASHFASSDGRLQAFRAPRPALLSPPKSFKELSGQDVPGHGDHRCAAPKCGAEEVPDTEVEAAGERGARDPERSGTGIPRGAEPRGAWEMALSKRLLLAFKRLLVKGSLEEAPFKRLFVRGSFKGPLSKAFFMRPFLCEVKRRVRQRLHKKLGGLLTCDEFGRAMEQFRLMEEEAAAPPPQPRLMATTPRPGGMSERN